jgi:hypothetical protein
MAGNLGKPTKPQWAYGAPSYTLEPSVGKKALGWEGQEKPPFQWMNWLFNQNDEWQDYHERLEDMAFSMFFRSDSTLTWTGTQVTFSQNLEFIFKVGGNVWENIIALADSPLDLADGEVLVAIFDDSNATLASSAYGAIASGNYAIVAESSLAENTDEHEVIIFRRRGSNLEIPLINQHLESGDTFTFAGTSIHTHSSNAEGGKIDHGLALNGLGDDDHTQYSLASGTRDYTGIVGYDSHKAFAADTDIIDKKYVDDEIAGITIDLTTDVTGILPIANGGTNSNSFTANRMLYYNGTSIVSTPNIYTNGTNLGIGVSPSYPLHVQTTSEDVAYFARSGASPGDILFNANGAISQFRFQSNGWLLDNASSCGCRALGNVFSISGSHDGYGTSYVHDLISPYQSSLAGGGATTDLASIGIPADSSLSMKVWVRAWQTASAGVQRSDLIIGQAGRTGAAAPALIQATAATVGAIPGGYNAQFVISGNNLIFRVTSGTNAIAIRAWIIKE